MSIQLRIGIENSKANTYWQIRRRTKI